MSSRSHYISFIAFGLAAAIITYGLGYTTAAKIPADKPSFLDGQSNLSQMNQENNLVQQLYNQPVEPSLKSQASTVATEFTENSEVLKEEIADSFKLSRQALVVPTPPRLDKQRQVRLTRNTSLEDLPLDAAISQSIPTLPEPPLAHDNPAVIKPRLIVEEAVHPEFSPIDSMPNLSVRSQPSSPPSGNVSHVSKALDSSIESKIETSTLKSNQNSLITDISGHRAESEILALVSAGIIEGFQDKTFRPNEIISQSEYEGLILRAKEHQMINSDFYLMKPDSIVNRADAAIYIYKKAIKIE